MRGAARGIQATLERTAQARAMSIDPLAPSSAFDETLRDRLRADARRRAGRGENGAVDAVGEDADVEGEDEDEDEEDAAENGRGRGRGEGTSAGAGARGGDDRLLVRDWRAPTGKRIAIPVRVEPKVYFAAERTFFVSFCLALPCLSPLSLFPDSP